MLPHKHFVLAAAVIAPATVVFYPEKSALETATWTLAGGTLSAAMDLDVLLLVFLRSGKEQRLRRYRNIINIFREFRTFKDDIAETGVMKSGLQSHFIIAALMVTVTALFLNTWLFPVLIAVVTHLISDLPNFRRLARMR